MGTEVLRPQDCLIQRIRVGPAVFNHRKTYNGNTRTGNGNRKPPSNQNQRKRSPEPKYQKNLASGSVTILKRGEFIDSKKNGGGMMDPDPVPDLAPIKLSSDMYAGSAFSLSPSPRALPLPSFFNKKQGKEFVDDSATRDLRRLLRLD